MRICIKYLLLFGFIFSHPIKPLLAQPMETPIQGCTIKSDNIEKGFSIIKEFSNPEGCTFEHTFSHNSVDYLLNVDLYADENPNSKIEVINTNNNQKYTFELPVFVWVTALDIHFLNLYHKNKPSLVIDYSHSSQGTGGCYTDITFYDASLPSGYDKVSAEQVNLGDSEGAIRTCFEYEDIDGDGIVEVLGHDFRFGYKFSSGAGSGLPKKVMKLKSNGLVDVSKNYKGFLRKQASDFWKNVLYESRAQSYYYYGQMAGYMAVKSLLGEYKEAKSLVNKRIQADGQRNTTEAKEFLSEIDSFLRKTKYLK